MHTEIMNVSVNAVQVVFEFKWVQRDT